MNNKYFFGDNEILSSRSKKNFINIQFNDLTYDVMRGTKSSKRILDGVSGEFRSGELSGIIGPSGGGKTTLLNLLAGYRLHKTSGYIKVNGHFQNMKQLRKLSRYVWQEDHLSPYFTVMETMLYASNFKLDSSCTRQQRQTVIDELLDTFQLKQRGKTMIYNISGGERKRLCIALELLNNPAVLILDEPTTGLDEYSATLCLDVLKRLAKSGHTIICSIHAPSTGLFEKFDKVYVVSEGQCIYQGTGKNVVPYLERFELKCPITYNPADFIIEVCSYTYGDFHCDMVQEIRNGKITKWSTDLESCAIQSSDIIEGAKAEDCVELELAACGNNISWWSEYKWIFWRIMKHMKRDKNNLQLRIILHILLAIFTGCAYIGVGTDASSSLYIYFIAFSMVIISVFIGMMAMLAYVPLEMKYLRREYFNQWYHLSSYFMALLTAQWPILIIMSIITTTLIYTMTDMPMEMFRLLLCIGITTLTSIMASSHGLLMGTTFGLLNSLFMGCSVMCFYVVLATIPIEKTELSMIEHILVYGSCARYSLEGILETFLKFDQSDFICPPSTFYCMFVKPSSILEVMGSSNISYIRSVLGLIGFNLLFALLAFVILKYRLRNSEFVAARYGPFRYVYCIVKKFY